MITFAIPLDSGVNALTIKGMGLKTLTFSSFTNISKENLTFQRVFKGGVCDFK